MEVVRDKADNCIIICSIENLDPMGVHTGDSITVAPAQTLTDKEYQILRNASLAVLREIGVDTGGSNVQFSINPKDGRMVVIEMNPRVSRSSALASKATGFPIAKVAAKLAVGYTLDELRNEITGGATPASFMGYGVANNLAAEEARGEYVLFLNNDAFLQPGAVSEMLVAFQKHSDCAAVGPVLRYPDGTLQEAGCSVAVDGHPIRHGREDRGFDLKGLPRYQPVDYVSGACLMMRRAEFLAMGGFAPKYSPAYYEDTDLCLWIQRRGKRVYLASRATCCHIENATAGGIEAGAWASRTAEAHRQIFLKDWGEWLERRRGKAEIG